MRECADFALKMQSIVYRCMRKCADVALRKCADVALRMQSTRYRCMRKCADVALRMI